MRRKAEIQLSAYREQALVSGSAAERTDQRGGLLPWLVVNAAPMTVAPSATEMSAIERAYENAASLRLLRETLTERRKNLDPCVLSQIIRCGEGLFGPLVSLPFNDNVILANLLPYPRDRVVRIIAHVIARDVYSGNTWNPLFS